MVDEGCSGRMLRREYRGVPLPSSATHLLVLVADLAESEAENRGEEHPHESAHLQREGLGLG